MEINQYIISEVVMTVGIQNDYAHIVVRIIS